MSLKPSQPHPSTLLTPQVLDSLDNIEMIARAMVEGTLTGLHRSPYHGFSCEFSEYRKYSPGDSVRYVDWIAYAKTDRYYVKKYEDETNTRAYVVLDQSASMALGQGKNRKFHYACYLAAAFIYLMQRQKDAVGLFTYTDSIGCYHPPRSSRLHMLTLLAQLESLRPAGRSDAAPCFRRIAETVHRRSLVIILSDFFDLNAEFRKSLRHFQHKDCEVMLFQILDPLETRFPFEGLIDFRDLESGEHMEIESADCRQAFLEDLQAHSRQMRQFCGRLRMSFEILNTGTAFAKALLAYLHTRQWLY